ncbi:MAG: histidinol-phosphatase HisJ [Fimbriimonadaceae bacterium]|nr:histidinol-phosphatase HisJ [Fimbriimonadaceae bacterium]
MILDPTFDGHSHTPWCPHGSDEPLRDYLEAALTAGLRRYAVTEHMPLPLGLHDPMGPLECANHPATLLPYVAEVEALRAEYAGRLEVLVGLEVDYLGAAQGGWHGAVLSLLATVHERLDPAATLLSLHFLDDGLVDATPALQRALLRAGEPIDALYLRYYAALRSALTASWTWRGRDLRPRRVGHLTLPSKFCRDLPPRDPARIEAAAVAVVELVAAEGLELDLNTAGWDKDACGEVYLTPTLLRRAVELRVPLVLGSDAHDPSTVGRYFQRAVDWAAAALG